MDQQSTRKGYKQTELGEIPEDWELSTIGDVTKWLSGGTPSRANESYWQGTIPWISGSTLKTFKITTSDQFLTREAVELGSKMAPLNSILILVRGSALHNEVRAGLVSADVAFNQDVKALVPDRTIIPEFLTFYLLGMANQLLKLVSSAGNSAGVLDTELVQRFILRKPKLKEQTAIANALSDTDALISALEKLINKKRAIKTATMQQLLTGKTRLPGFDKHPNGKPKGMKQTELGEIPEDWETFLIPECAWYQEGPGVRKYQFRRNGVKLLNGTNIEHGCLKLEKTDKYISEKEAFGPYSHFLVDDGDILIACSGVTIAKFDEKVTVADGSHLPLCMNTSTMRFKPVQEKLVAKYLVNYLKSSLFKQQIGGTATGSAQLNFGPFHVGRAKIVLPTSLREQTAIANILSDVDSEIESLDRRIEKTKQIKQGMMQKLLTGRTRLI